MVYNTYIFMVMTGDGLWHCLTHITEIVHLYFGTWWTFLGGWGAPRLPHRVGLFPAKRSWACRLENSLRLEALSDLSESSPGRPFREVSPTKISCVSADWMILNDQNTIYLYLYQYVYIRIIYIIIYHIIVYIDIGSYMQYTDTDSCACT